jgi:hypothetical protein
MSSTPIKTRMKHLSTSFNIFQHIKKQNFLEASGSYSHFKRPPISTALKTELSLRQSKTIKTPSISFHFHVPLDSFGLFIFMFHVCAVFVEFRIPRASSKLLSFGTETIP